MALPHKSGGLEPQSSIRFSVKHLSTVFYTYLKVILPTLHQLFKVSSGADRSSFLLKKKKLEKIFYQHMFSVMFRSLFHSVIPKIRPSYCKSNSAAQKLQHPMAILVFTSNFSSHTKR